MRLEILPIDYQILSIVDAAAGDVVATREIHQKTDRTQRTVERRITQMVLPTWCDRRPWLTRETGGVAITDDGFSALDGLRKHPEVSSGQSQRAWIDRMRNPWRECDSRTENVAIPGNKRPPMDNKAGLWFWCDECGRKAWHDEGGCRCRREVDTDGLWREIPTIEFICAECFVAHEAGDGDTCPECGGELVRRVD